MKTLEYERSLSAVDLIKVKVISLLSEGALCHCSTKLIISL